MSPSSFPKLTINRRSDYLPLLLYATTSQRDCFPQVAADPVSRSPHWATVPHSPPPICSDQTMCLKMTKIFYNLLTNTLRSGTEFPSAIYLVDAKKIDNISADLPTSDCYNNYTLLLLTTSALILILRSYISIRQYCLSPSWR